MRVNRYDVEHGVEKCLCSCLEWKNFCDSLKPRVVIMLQACVAVVLGDRFWQGGERGSIALRFYQAVPEPGKFSLIGRGDSRLWLARDTRCEANCPLGVKSQPERQLGGEQLRCWVNEEDQRTAEGKTEAHILISSPVLLFVCGRSGKVAGGRVSRRGWNA